MNEERAIETLEQAIAWCHLHQMRLDFITVYGYPRVRAYGSGCHGIERDTVLKVIQACNAHLEELKRNGWEGE